RQVQFSGGLGEIQVFRHSHEIADMTQLHIVARSLTISGAFATPMSFKIRKWRRHAQYTSTSTAACSADFTTSSNFRWWPSANTPLSLADASGTDSRKLSKKLLFTA